MTRILLVGASGKMGRVIAARCREEKDCRIVAGVDVLAMQNEEFPVYPSIDLVNEPADVIVDFSHPSVTASVLQYAKAKNLPAVIATTGLAPAQTEAVRKTAQTVPVFFSANMSVGINLMAALAKRMTAILGGTFDIEIIEKHHNQKIDAPSGTALLLADAISGEMPGGAQYVYDRHSQRRKRAKNEIGLHSVRGGTIVGEHEILFAGPDEMLEIKHTATSKDVFAAGAVRAAQFLIGKEPGLYSMADLVQL